MGMGITTITIGPDWGNGRYLVEYKCDHAHGRRAAECVQLGWHCIASSDEIDDALQVPSGPEAQERWTYRVVDGQTDAVMG